MQDNSVSTCAFNIVMQAGRQLKNKYKILMRSKVKLNNRLINDKGSLYHCFFVLQEKTRFHSLPASASEESVSV